MLILAQTDSMYDAVVRGLCKTAFGTLPVRCVVSALFMRLLNSDKVPQMF